MTEFLAILLTAALFLAVVLTLAVDNAFRKRTTGIVAAVGAAIGIILYGYGYSYVFGFGPVALLRALMTVCRMFGGVNDLGAIQSAPWFGSTPVMVIFWAGHFLAFYVTASTAVAALGGRLLRQLRTVQLRRGELLLIYGVNPESIAYGRMRIQNGHRAVMFVDENCDAAQETAIIAMGGIVEKRSCALQPDADFLKKIALRRGDRKLCAAALHTDGQLNLVWSRSLMETLTSEGIRPEQSSLLIRGVKEQVGASLMSSGNDGFGTVYAFSEYTLAARLMIRSVPPCTLMRFNADGRAEDDFTVAIVGFGRMGRAVLEQLVMNGQFAGSGFRADIFANEPQKGSLLDSELIRKHDVIFHNCGGRSDEFYDHLMRNPVKMIVLCTGSSLTNQEIAQDLLFWYDGKQHAPAVIRITRDSLYCENADGKASYQQIFGSDALDTEKMDRLAMIINQQYSADNGKTAEENWKKCDYFSRMSCRASADFAPAFVRIAGSTRDDIIAGGWQISKTMLENLAKTEHLRWCAFHEVMGWHPMSREIWDQRAKRYTDEKKEYGSSSVRIGKDVENKLHACLVSWEDLNELSERENMITGVYTDYLAMDRDNVLALPELLRQESLEE